MNNIGILFLRGNIINKITTHSFGTFLDKRLSCIKNDSYRILSSAGLYLLEKMTDTPIDKLNIYIDKHGKPQISGNAFHFNISHSGKAVICGISDCPIGVDIELIGDIKESVFKKCFTALERADINSNKDFYKYWTLKEAYLKYLGSGIDRAMNSIEFEINDNIICRDRNIAVNEKFASFQINEYQASICSSELIEISDVYEYNVDI